MEYRKFGNYYVMRIDRKEEVLTEIAKLCEKEQITLGYATGLGATDRVELGVFDTVNRVYHKHELEGTMEITSLVGNISTKDGKPYLHFHINVCNEARQVFGGHLNACHVSATCEVTVVKIAGTVEREMSSEVGLNLYRFL